MEMLVSLLCPMKIFNCAEQIFGYTCSPVGRNLVRYSVSGAARFLPDDTDICNSMSILSVV